MVTKQHMRDTILYVRNEIRLCVCVCVWGWCAGNLQAEQPCSHELGFSHLTLVFLKGTNLLNYMSAA